MRFAVNNDTVSWAAFTIKRTLDFIALEMEKGTNITPELLRNAQVEFKTDHNGQTAAKISFVEKEEDPLDTTFVKE